MRVKKLHRYPIEYWNIVRVAHQQGSFSVDCKSLAEAKKLRENLYNFRKALHTSLSSDPENDRLLLSTARADRLIYSIYNTTVKVHVPST